MLGAGADEIRASAKIDPPVVVILNSNWERGQLSSICAGIKKRLDGIDTDGFILCPVDHPLVSASLVNKLIEQFHAHHKAIVLLHIPGRRGHPVIFSRSLYEELSAAPLVHRGARRGLGTRRRRLGSDDRRGRSRA